MKEAILLTHVYINKNEKEKINAVEFSLKHFRKNNPDTYLVLVGHGIKPLNAKIYCDHMIWFEKIIESDINVGHPKLVNIGLKYLKEKNIDYVLKTRADTIHLHKNLVQLSKYLLGEKKILITQITHKQKLEMGDLFMFSQIDFMISCWSLKKWFPTKTGVTSLAKNFLNVTNSENWIIAIKKYSKLVDIFTLKWIDFRSNWDELKTYKEDMLENRLHSYEIYLWGSYENWVVWNKNGEFLPQKSKHKNIFTEKDF